MADAPLTLPADEVASLGEDIYNSQIRPVLKPEDKGKVVAIDVQSGDFSLGKHSVEAGTDLLTRHPHAKIWYRRVGFRTLYYFGGPPVDWEER